jgi:hypothetical protein
VTSSPDGRTKLRAAIAHVMPAGMLAEQHRKMAEPGKRKVS